VDNLIGGRSLGNQSTKHSQGGLLVVGVVALESNLDLLVDLLSCGVRLIALLLPLGDLPDALLDYLGGRVSHILPIVFEGLEDDLVVVLLAKELIERDDLLLAAKLSQN